MTAYLLVEIMLKSTVVLLLAWLVTCFMTRSSAATRHLVWTAAFLGILTLPLLVLVSPKWKIATVPEEWSAQPQPSPFPAPAATASGTTSRIDRPGATSLMKNAETKPARSLPSRVQLFPLLVDIVLSVMFVMILKLMLGVIWAARVRRQAAEIVESGWLESLHDATVALKMKHSVRVLKSDRTSIACTSGVLHPRILVPIQAEQWNHSRRNLVLLHELGHVKRHDCLIQTLARIATSLYWFNPLAHLAAARMAFEQEQACDDLVLTTGMPAANYADELVEIARAFRRSPLTDGLTLAMARPSHLAKRVAAILDQRRRRHSPSRTTYAGITLIACLGIVILGTVGLGSSSLSSEIQLVFQPPALVEMPFRVPAIPIKTKPPLVRAAQSQKPLCGSVVACEAVFATSDPDLVFVNATVSDAQDRLVTGLHAENFQVWEDKSDQTIEYFSEAPPLTLGMIMGNLSAKLATDLETLVRGAGGDPLLAIDKYFLVRMAAQSAFLEEDFTSDASRIQNHTTPATIDNDLPVFDSIYLSLEKIGSATGRKALLIIADRGDSSRYSVANVKALAQQQDVQIFVIGIQATAAMRAGLEDLVSVNSGQAFFPNSESELTDILQKIGLALRTQYMLGYHPTNRSLDGNWRALRVKVLRPSGLGPLWVRARSGYFARIGFQGQSQVTPEFVAQIEPQFKVLDDQLVAPYVNRIGQTLVQNSDAKFPFTIKVLDSPDINAFTLPGGHLYISAGLILATAKEAELAAVMAHEIAHDVALKGEVSKGTLISYATIPLQDGGPLIPLLLPSEVGEKEADYLGLQYLFKTGYDPGAFIHFSEKLQATSEPIHRLFSTHLPGDERLELLHKHVDMLQAIRPPFIVTTPEYLAVKAKLARR